MTDGSDRNEKKNRILSAALEAYMKYGISEATTRQVSDIAGIGKSTIYEYFKDKDELVDEAFLYFIREMAEGRRSVGEIGREDPVLALSAYIDNTVRMALDEPDRLLLLTQYTVAIFFKTRGVENVKGEYHKRVFPTMKSLVDEIGVIIARGIETGAMKPAVNVSLDSLAYAVLALIREIQAQAFIQDGTELKKVCGEIKGTIFAILGIER